MKSHRRGLALVALLAIAAVAPSARAQQTQTPGPPGQQAPGRWEQQAERAFSLGRGQGQQLMTQEEWQEHQRRMQNMTAEERERYRQEVHQRMLEQARERGIVLPEVPGPRGPMGGPGMGGPGTGGWGSGGRGGR